MRMLLAEISADARWLLEALVADAARGSAPSWAAVSAFHHLRTRPPKEHPGFGTALLQWQRMVARFGEQTSRLAAEAFLALPRATDREARPAARVLELWCRHAPLPIEVPGRIVALEHLPEAEAALVAEELALGAHENGKPSKGVLQLVATRPGAAFAEARALAQLERFLRGDVDAGALAEILAPGLLEPGEVALPEVTAHLVGGLRHPLAYVPDLPGVEPIIRRIRLAAARARSDHPAATSARRLIACCASLEPEEVLALAEPDAAAEPSEGVGLPSAEQLAPQASEMSEELAVRVALLFPQLSGAVEQGAGLPGLTAWRAAREPEVPLTAATRALKEIDPARKEIWDRVAGGAVALPDPAPSWTEQLTESLRTGALLPRDALLASGVSLDGLLFDSPGGPGLLRSDGQLENALRRWPAPERLAVSHPIDLFDAERQAWQARLLASGAVAPLNQLFREQHKAGGRELTRKRIDRLRGTRIGPAALELLSRRGWFPTLAPVDVAPELVLGAYRARLKAEHGPSGPVSVGVEFLHEGKAVQLSEVPPRLFSEAWRDVDEALALMLNEGSYVPSAARAELVRAVGARLGLHDLRVESDHVAFRIEGHPERITLHNARPADGELLAPAAARTRAAEVLPFVDDGGIAALLVGRILARVRPGAAPGVPKEGT